MAQDESLRSAVILHEYESASQLTFHVDELRARLTSFFITAAGVSIAGLALLLKSDNSVPDYPVARGIISSSFIAVALVGLVVIAIIARLRRVQIEHFRIINNIRTLAVDGDARLASALELSDATLPKPSRRSGSYFWVLAIIVLSSFSLGVGVFMLLGPVSHVLGRPADLWAGSAGGLIFGFASDQMYFWLVRPAKRQGQAAGPIQSTAPTP